HTLSTQVAPPNQAAHYVADCIHTGDWLPVVVAQRSQVLAELVSQLFNRWTSRETAVVEKEAGPGIRLQYLIGNAEGLLERCAATVGLVPVQEHDGRLSR